MSKKSKKFATENDAVTTNEAAQPTEAVKATPFAPKNPAIFLRASDGSEFKFTHFPLPKKAAVAGQMLVNGVPTDYQVTSNKGFTKEDTVINYAWMTLPEGQTGYIAMDYNTEPVAGTEFSVEAGKTERKDPARVAKDDTVGAARVEKFKATMAARKEQEPAAA
jgi:hypothetical protein